MLSASSRRLVGMVLALGLTAFAGCSPQRPASPQLQTAGTVATVGSVVVTVSEAVTADRQERFAKVDGQSRLMRAIESELTHAARLGDSILKEYTTGAGTSGAFAGLDQVSRFEKLATAVSERVVKQL
jgi:hypothetical protein